MSGFDWIIVAVVALSVLVAIAQGFFFEIFTLAGAIVGYILAAWEYGRVAPWFLPYVRSQTVANGAGFMLIFMLVTVLAGVAGKVTRWMMKEVGLGLVDRFLGGAFGLVRGAVVVAVAVLAIATFAPDTQIMRDSRLGGYFLVGARAAAWLAPAELRDKFKDGVATLRKGRMEAARQASSAKPEAAAAKQD